MGLYAGIEMGLLAGRETGGHGGETGAQGGETGAQSLEVSSESGVCLSSHTSCQLRMAADCQKENCGAQFTVIIFPFLALFIGVLAKPISRTIKLPYTLFLLIIGMMIGLLGCGVDLGLLSTSLKQWIHIHPPTTFFYVFLAPLIFEASFNAEWHVFKRLLVPILTAAFVIVLLQIGLIATFQKKVIQTEGWTWWAALMFGAMLSATDPISVTATLKSLGASEFLNTLIEGESLVNDGSAFVLFEAFFENTEENGVLSVGDIVAKVFRLSVGGMVMGMAFGIGALLILSLVYDEFEVETSLTVIVAFLGFWTAQAPSKLSGVICNVASGLVISAFGRHLITPAVRHPLAEFWELLSWVANTIVFVHAGLLLSVFTWSCAGDPNRWQDYVYILVYFLFLQVIRMGLIFLFRPFMALRNKWFQWREATVVGFSGLRGAVSLILALEVAGSEHIPEVVKARIVLWVTGIVGLSLLVNGFFIKPLITLLKLDKAKKSREDFLRRGRAIMVQRALTILDCICIETGFKAARWSYVVKNALPSSWLEDDHHGEEYREALEQLMDNRALASRKSLESVRNEERAKVTHSQVSHRLSMDAHSMQPTPNYTPRTSTHGQALGNPSRVSFSPMVNMGNYGGGVQSPGRHSLNDPGVLGEPTLNPQHLARLSIAVSHRGDRPFSIEGTNRMSIDADVDRYRPGPKPRRHSRAQIYRDVAELHKRSVAGQESILSDEDREVQRRLLTAILSHVRALSNASLVEFSVVHNLEMDCQRALDANDEGREYDLFSFLDNRGRHASRFLHKQYLHLIEGKKLRGQTSITTAVLVFGIMTEILKEEMLHTSPVVQLQAEQLYEGAAALLNRLEALNPRAFEWVETQFAVYVSARKQDEVLQDMLSSGIVDNHEYKVLHEELIDVRRRHVQSRHSILRRSRQGQLADRPIAREQLREHPLFANLSSNLMTTVVDSFGQLVHLEGGQALQCEKGSLIVVLNGAIRPLEQNVLPTKYANQVLKTNKETDMAITDMLSPPHSPSQDLPEDLPQKQSSSSGSGAEEDPAHAAGFTPLASGATMHWCFPADSAFCGPAVTLHSHNSYRGSACPIARERLVETQFCACEITGTATVFTLPVVHVRRLAKESPDFRIEITRSLAREIVLESVSDQRPYSLSNFMDSVEAGVSDVHTVVGRAFRVLERLPYMSVIPLMAGELAAVHVQGPGVLLNGTVRVSIVDTSGLVGAINLLHEELTGPALLPSGGLIIQEVHKEGNPEELRKEFGDIQPLQPIASEMAKDAANAACELLDQEDDGFQRNSEERSSILAHILVEQVYENDQTAVNRLQRWTAADAQVDMNGRFGMYRHVELARLHETKVE